MLEPVRQYAAELLGEGGEAETVRRRHADYYLSLAEHEEPELGRIGQAAQLNMLQAEHDNLRAAFQWLEDDGDETARLRMAACLGWFWLFGGHWSEGRARLHRALGGDGGDVRARALYYAAELAYAQGNLADARSLYEGSISTLRAVGDRRGLAQALHRLGEVLWSYGDAEGIRAVNEEAAPLFREARDTGGLAGALRGQGKAAILTGDHAHARSLLEESVALSQAAGDAWGTAMALHELSRVALLGSDPAQARTAAEGSLSRFEMVGDKKGVIVSLHNLGLAAAMAGEHEQARTLHERALLLCEEVGDTRFLPRSLAGLANVSRVQGSAERAARLLGAVDALMEAIFPPVRPSERTGSESAVAAVRATLSEERFAAAWAEGRAMSREEAVEYSLSGV
jgi:tetratricopeptide (TPR) repeat protein